MSGAKIQLYLLSRMNGSDRNIPQREWDGMVRSFQHMNATMILGFLQKWSDAGRCERMMTSRAALQLGVFEQGVG